MKKTLLGIVGVMMIAAMSGHAATAFKAPTAEQLAAAASNPAAIEALLVGASPEQAAQVIKAVVVQIMALGLSPTVQAASISSVVSTSFAAAPSGSAPLLAASLGTACGSTVAISAYPAVVSSIQGTIATAGGSAGAVMAEAFATAYTAAKAVNTPASDSPPPPPVATGYNGQRP